MPPPFVRRSISGVRTKNDGRSSQAVTLEFFYRARGSKVGK